MRHVCRTLAISLCAVLLAVGTLTFADADARNISYDLNIPSEDLTAALQSFAIASHHKLLYKAELTAGKTSRALIGHYTAQEAMEALLSGTGLSYEITGSSVVLIKNQADAKTSDLREVGILPSSDAAIQSRSGQPILLAQTNPPTSSPDNSATTVGRSDPPKDSSLESEKDKISEIVVTGTNIRGVAPVGAPFTVIDQAAIRDTGYGTLAQLLQTIPQNFKGGDSGASADANFSPGITAGFNLTYGTGVNLRGLGTNATLTLINGMRAAASTSGGFTDISLIPLAAIDRIEILPDGASAIYGSDAVGGVINFVLKKNYDGAETRVRYGTTTQTGTSDRQVTQTLGKSWDGGGGLMVAQCDSQTELKSTDRLATETAPAPTSVIPANTSYSLVFSGHQSVAAQWEAQSDVTYTQKYETPKIAGFGAAFLNDIGISRYSASIGIHGSLSESWQVTGSFGTSSERPRSDAFQATTNSNEYTNLYSVENQSQRETDGIVKLDGSLLSLPAGDVKAAIGGEIRKEQYSDIAVFNPSGSRSSEAMRKVKSAFGELYIPIVSESNSIVAIKSLKMSFAARFDNYSDFGKTTNPKAGIEWVPFADFTLRGSYGTSFRAPSIGNELALGVQGTSNIFLYPFINPAGGQTPVAVLSGSKALHPETSDDLSLGFNYAPRSLRGFKVSLDYFNIKYKNRIGYPSFYTGAIGDPAFATYTTIYPSNAALRQFINPIIAGGVPLLDFTGGVFGPNPLNQATVVYDYRQQNASQTHINGLDLDLNYAVMVFGDGLATGVTYSYIGDYSTSAAHGAPFVNLLNTYGDPVRSRLRGYANWRHGSFTSNVIFNYTGTYKDTSTVPAGRVRAYETVDLNVEYRVDSKTTVSFAASNLFNQAPPYIVAAFDNSHYDAANASVIGRTVAVEVRRVW
jgi:iron complex outermembrane receptor protein